MFALFGARTTFYFFMKPSHRPIPSDRTMVLLDDVVEIFDLTNHDRNILAGIDLSDRRSPSGIQPV